MGDSELVRDKIPQIIRAKGLEAEERVASLGGSFGLGTNRFRGAAFP